MADSGFREATTSDRLGWSGRTVASWGRSIGVSFSGTAGSNATPSPDEPIGGTNVCSIISIGGAAWFKQGDLTVVATADPYDSIYLPAYTWVDITTASAKYVSFIQASGSSAVLAQIAERW